MFGYTCYTFLEVARVNTARGVGQLTKFELADDKKRHGYFAVSILDLDSQIDILQAQQEHTLSEAI